MRGKRKPLEQIRPASRACRARRDATIDPEFRAPGKARQERIDLGLAILRCHSKPGQARSLEEIAAWCGVSYDTIYMYERRALKRLRTLLVIRKDPRLIELLAQFFERRECAQPVRRAA